MSITKPPRGPAKYMEVGSIRKFSRKRSDEGQNLGLQIEYLPAGKFNRHFLPCTKQVFARYIGEAPVNAAGSVVDGYRTRGAASFDLYARFIFALCQDPTSNNYLGVIGVHRICENVFRRKGRVQVYRDPEKPVEKLMELEVDQLSGDMSVKYIPDKVDDTLVTRIVSKLDSLGKIEAGIELFTNVNNSKRWCSCPIVKTEGNSVFIDPRPQAKRMNTRTFEDIEDDAE